VFVDEVNEFNGPLWFIPQSHKKGAIEAKHDLTTTSYPLWVIDNDTDRQAGEAGRHRGAQGPAGSAIFFHGTLVHGSPPNMSPWDRQIIYCDLQLRAERHPPLQAPGLYRAPRFHAARRLGRRLRDPRRPPQGRGGITTFGRNR
jgi:ectoine hydroxylase-related dioxygenase (phytanoyl-CoA dioxygenase family)